VSTTIARSVIGFSATAVSDFTIDNITVKEVLTWADPKYYLDFDGVDDYLTSNSVDLSGTSQVDFGIAVEALTPRSNNSLVIGTATNDTSNGSTYINSGDGSTDGWNARVRGATGLNALAGRYTDSYPAKRVITVQTDLAAAAGSEVFQRFDGVQQGTPTGDADSGPFGNFPFQMGLNSRTSTYFFGDIYGSVVLGRTLTSDERDALESYLATKSGVTLP
jgi:hypothetical protein